MQPNALSLSLITGLVLSLGMAAAAEAQTVKIDNAVARVVVIPENRVDVGVEVIPGKADLPGLQVVRRGQSVEIDGQLSRRATSGLRGGLINRCESTYRTGSQPGEGARVEVRGHGRIALEDAPLVVVRTPLGVDVSSSGAVFGSVGPGAQTLQLQSAGCGGWTVGNVADKADIILAGSGSVRMGTARSLNLRIGGSGTVEARETRDLRIAIGGSGDVRLSRLNGNGSIQVGGAGDVRIDGGRANRLDIAVAGSGDVRFDGRVEDVSISIAGSGDVYVREATGRVSKSVIGSGDVHIGR